MAESALTIAMVAVMVIVINLVVSDHIKQADNDAKVKVNMVVTQVEVGLEGLKLGK